MSVRVSLFFVLLVLLAACAAPPAQVDRPPAPHRVLAYNCEPVDPVAAFYADHVRLFLPGDNLRLPQQTSASGARYGDGRTTFWTKGESAILESRAAGRLNCRVDSMRSIWEAARLRGIHFRAVGNEPGWYLEIGPEQSLLNLDYGQREIPFATPSAENDVIPGSTSYRATIDDRPLTILLEPRRCNDTMIERSYETTVTVSYGDEIYRGCGQTLH
ncbi:MAG: MliC family protein [Desulfuromonadales bacterium]|nr:MliC family protein [Desulfuromonadales bacterium]